MAILQGPVFAEEGLQIGYRQPGDITDPVAPSRGLIQQAQPPDVLIGIEALSPARPFRFDGSVAVLPGPERIGRNARPQGSNPDRMPFDPGSRSLFSGFLFSHESMIDKELANVK
jgi:hypothetical protein